MSRHVCNIRNFGATCVHHYCMYMPYWCVEISAWFVSLRTQVQHIIAVCELDKEADILRAMPAQSILRAHAAACMPQHADALRDARSAVGTNTHCIAEGTDRVRRRM